MKSQLFRRLWSSTPIRYVLVGGTGFLFELLVLFLATETFMVGTVLSVTISFWLGLAFSFYLQKVLAFESKDHSLRVLGIQGFLYGLLVLINFGFTVGFAALTAPVVGIYFSRGIALAITTLWNYFLYRAVIFNDRLTGAKAGKAAASPK